MRAIVAERGQVTIPKALRERLGIGPKTILEFREEGGRLIAEKATQTDPVSRVLGCVKSDKSTDEFIEELRGAP